MLLLGFFLAFLREQQAKKSSWKNYARMGLFIGVLATTKLTGLALAPVLLLLVVALDYSKRKSFQHTLIYFFVVALIVGCCWEGGYSGDGKASQLISIASGGLWNAGRLVLNPFRFAEQFQRTVLTVFNFPPNDCLNQLWFGENLELVKGAFFYLFLPFMGTTLFGFKKAFESKEIQWIAIALVALLGFGIVFYHFLVMSEYILPRYALPVYGLLGLVFTKGFISLKTEKLKRIVFVSFALYCAYSFAYSANSTYRYWQVDQAFDPGLRFVEEMPGEASFLISYVPAGKINLMDGKSTISVGRARAGQQPSHAFIGCYREQISPNLISGELLYSDDCSQVWRVDSIKVPATDWGEKELGAGNANENISRLLDECH